MTEPARVCAVSIDLDGIGCYYRIHGLRSPPAELEHVILERALPRAAALFAQKKPVSYTHLTLPTILRV